MSMSDTLGDMLTRIRNGQSAKKFVVDAPASRFRGTVLDVLKREGYIRNYTQIEKRPGINEFKIELKYYDGKPVISEIKRVSTPGRRIYSGIKDLPKVYNGLGISIISTPRGVMSDNEARAAQIGGEVLCQVF
ncbi:MAG: 30S ribosomal protein S8 [Proteobacteria bacterium]|nr:30S ribosomal protein S8 [Pseudomonadota bacterium]MDA1136501.1 30S ribosomal protein S8 [Pseudomonadota bacterium]